MPRIPGVNDDLNTRSSAFAKPSTKLTILVVAFLVVLGVMAWRLRSSSSLQPAPAASAASIAGRRCTLWRHPLAVRAATVGSGSHRDAGGTCAAVGFEKVYFCKTRHARGSRCNGDSASWHCRNRSNAYWAFALTPPFGRCDLEYVTDVKELAARYGYSTTHPMLAAPCSGSLYDPLRMGIIGNGAWTRGEVVQGPGIRPPTAIRIQVSGQSIIADRIE